MSYFGMHNHTEYSNITTDLDSINRLDDLVGKAKELGLSGIAITDHDNLCSVIDVNRLQKKLIANEDDFTLAIGNEIYLINKYEDDDNNKQYYYHFILIAKDEIGYKAIVELSTRAWYRSSILRGRRRVPTEKQDLRDIITPEVKGHIIASTACLGGELAKSLLAEEYERATTFVEEMRDIFGEEDFYIELQPSDSLEQTTFNRKVTEMFKDYNFVITTDAHYQNKEDFPILEAFLRSDEKNKKREVKEYYDFARLMGEEEVISLMKLSGIDEEFCKRCFSNTNKVKGQIKFFDLAQTQVVPKVTLEHIPLEVPQSYLDQLADYEALIKALADKNEQTEYCTNICLNELFKRNLWNEEYLGRLNEEFDVFEFQGERLGQSLFAYFNGMKHFIDLAWSVDCAVGPSRGSGSGSLTCWLMGIIQGNPIQHGLYFWRFLNKDRLELPKSVSFIGQVKMGERLLGGVA